MEAYINGMLIPLDDYLEKYGQGIIEQVGRKNIECCNINNTYMEFRQIVIMPV